MDIQGWNDRYRLKDYQAEEKDASPTPLLAETVKPLFPGSVLDLACGAGRNALWLAANGWSVTAVDGSSAAIDLLRDGASAKSLTITAQIADLQAGEYRIAESAWDLILMAYYLQRDLFRPGKKGRSPRRYPSGDSPYLRTRRRA